MEEFINNLAELLERNIQSVNPDDRFREYEEWDSLALLGLGAMIDENYSIVIPRKEFEQIVTVKEIYDFIQNNK
jgi:acyl carrier protein